MILGDLDVWGVMGFVWNSDLKISRLIGYTINEKSRLFYIYTRLFLDMIHTGTYMMMFSIASLLPVIRILTFRNRRYEYF